MLTGLPAERFPRLGRRARAIGDDETLRRLNRLALGACQQDPSRRFRDARDMLAELKSLKMGQGKRPVQRPRLVVVCAVVLLIVVAAVVAIGLWPENPKSAPVLEPSRVSVNFITHPFEATILLNGVPLQKPDGQPYKTPCTVPDLAAAPHRVVFRHPDHGEFPAGEFDFAKSREIEASWD